MAADEQVGPDDQDEPQYELPAAAGAGGSPLKSDNEAELLEDDFGNDESSVTETVELRIRPVHGGRRLDSFLAARFTDRSRSYFQKLIKSGNCLVNGRKVKPSQEVTGGDIIHVELPPREKNEIEPENIPLEIVYEDDFFVVINKPYNMIVHPARGNWGGTLVNALAYHFQQLSGLNGPERPGIVHRLDRDTTGIIVVAKNDSAHAQIARQWENRRVRKEYLALVEGNPQLDADVIDKPIGRHPKTREKMAIDGLNPREAVTHYEIQERFRGYAYVRAMPRTGRTHQIRVHLASVNLRILADKMYSSRSQITVGDLMSGGSDGYKNAGGGGDSPAAGAAGEMGGDDDVNEILINRQALHACRLSLWHPITGKHMTFETPLPPDMQRTLEALRKYRSL